MRAICVLALCFAAVAAVPANPQRIVGGSVTTIQNYPEMVALLYTWNMSNYWQRCGGTILNSRSILTCAHCPVNDEPYMWRIRVGSAQANSGGVVYQISNIFIHPNYVPVIFESDIAVMRTTTSIIYTDTIKAAFIAGSNYNLRDNEAVWAAGWGATFASGWLQEQLRHVQMWTINQELCAGRYTNINRVVSANMFCAGWLDVGGRDQCQGDSGGPVYHNGVVVGVCSWGEGCGHAFYPGVNARVSRFTNWISSHS